LETVDEIIQALDGFIPSADSTETVARLHELLRPLRAMPDSGRAVRALYGVLERFPDADLGSPGPIVHALERVRGYETELRQSLVRLPTSYTLWMCNRVLNASTDPQEEDAWMAALEAAASHPLASESAHADAISFLAFQRGESQE